MILRVTPRATRPSTHGLAGMRHRVEAAGGRLTVTSRPGEGTRITAVLPRREDHRPVRGRRFDRARYRQRHVIECTVGHLKEFRRIAQRADKLAVRYHAWVILGMVRLILRRPFLNTA